MTTHPLPPTACAEPREWDVVGYDECMADVLGRIQSGEIAEEHLYRYKQDCCERTDGVWNDTLKECFAPPGNQAGVPRTLPSGVPTQTLQPAPPPSVRTPGDVTQTFTPAPVSPG